MGKFEGNSLVGKIVILSRELNQIWGSAVYLDLVFLSSTGAETSRFEWGKVSIKICVEHICVSIYGENELNWGIFFFNFSKVHVCQCNMGKFEGNSLIGKIVILSRELNPIWGSAVYLDLVFRSCTGAETSRFEWGKVSIKICVEHICVSIYQENELNWGISFFFSKVLVCQCNMGKFEGNSLVGKIVILSRELNQIWGSAVYLDLVFLSSTGAETSRFEWGKISIKICVEHICVSIYQANELNWGIFFL